MDRHAHDGIIRNAVGATQLPGQIDHRMISKLPKLLVRVLGVGFHLRHVVLWVASQAKDEAQEFHARIDYHPQRVRGAWSLLASGAVGLRSQRHYNERKKKNCGEEFG